MMVCEMIHTFVRLVVSLESRGRCVWLILFFLTLSVRASSEPLTKIAEIRALSREAAAKGLPVKVRGVVTSSDSRGCITLQDSTGGIWIDPPEAKKRNLWRGDDAMFNRLRDGLEVQITGRSDPGGYAPIILPEYYEILGEKPLPDPIPFNPVRFFSGSDSCSRVEVRGVVQGVHPWANGVTLSIDANPGRFKAYVSHHAAVNPAALIDAEVCLRGVAGARFNTRGEATGTRLLVRMPGDLVIEKPPVPPEMIPKVTLDRLLPFRVDSAGPHRVRVEGTVTHALPGRFLYLQDGENAARVETTSKVSFKPGDRVEAAGFVEISRFVGTLRDATIRKTGAGMVVAPLKISPLEILAIHEDFVKSQQVTMTQDYDGQLVRCRANLLAVETEVDPANARRVTTLTLEQMKPEGQGNFTFRAQLHDRRSERLESLQPGSVMDITGIVKLEFAADEINNPNTRSIPVHVGLILRDEAEALVIQQPTWWTAAHFIGVISLVLIALGGAMIWNLQLKREVRRKTRQLIREKDARREAAIEFNTTMRERNRLAANLHDTLPQSMGGIGLQLDACEMTLRKLGIDSLPPLEVARRMVDYSINELRSAVWEMRSLSLRGRSFTAALQAVVDQASSGHPAKVRVTTDGPLEKVPEFVSGNLLLIVQEALRNALQHGKPEHINIEIHCDAPGAPIYLEFLDDGCGFHPNRRLGPEQGHYGIVGMRERAERLGGSLRVHSAPGHGTRITAKVLQDGDDEDVAGDDFPKLHSCSQEACSKSNSMEG